MESFEEIKKSIRDTKLENIFENTSHDVSIDFPKIGWFGKPNKFLKYLFKSGCILTGSRGLQAHTVNGVSLLNRDPDDWDFICNEKTFHKICREKNLIWDKSGGFMTVDIENSLFILNGSYGGRTHFGRKQVHLILEEYLPDHKENKKGIKIADYNYILDCKVKMVEAGRPLITENNKHVKDLKWFVSVTKNI